MPRPVILDVGAGNDDAVALTTAAMRPYVDMVDELIDMGGAWKSGNRAPAPEFDICVDAVAADALLGTGVERLTVAPLDATHEVLVTRDDVRRSSRA